MSYQQFDTVIDWLMYFMQASIFVPMTVVWWHQRHFPPPVKLLSWYVYLSVVCVAASRLYPTYLPNNYGGIIGFNLGKMLLLGAVYYQVLPPGRMRQVVPWLTGACLAGVALVLVIGHDLKLAMSVSRVTQCALLAALALAYLEHALSRETRQPFFRDPLWLLSVGQLFYSAGTITAFSFDYFSRTNYDVSVKFIFVVFSGLIFNCFLTLAFLRASSGLAPVPEAEEAPVEALVRS